MSSLVPMVYVKFKNEKDSQAFTELYDFLQILVAKVVH